MNEQRKHRELKIFIYFVREVFSGHGVPTAWLHSADYVQNMYKLKDGTSAECDFFIGKLSNQNKLSKMNQIAPIESGLESMGMNMFKTLLNHPVDAVNMGIDPLLVIDWTKEVGVQPFMFIWFLLSTCLCLCISEYVLKRCSANGATVLSLARKDKIKNISTYCTELIVSTSLLFIAYNGTWELLMFQFPERMLSTINSVVVCIVCMNGLYLCELFYHDNMRLSLKVHHYACILMQLITMLYIQERQLAILRMGLYNTLFGMTEQNVFITMILHPSNVLKVSPSLSLYHIPVRVYLSLFLSSHCGHVFCGMEGIFVHPIFFFTTGQHKLHHASGLPIAINDASKYAVDQLLESPWAGQTVPTARQHEIQLFFFVFITYHTPP